MSSVFFTTALISLFMVSLSGCSSWRKAPAETTSQSAESDLLVSRLNSQVSSLGARCEGLEVEVFRTTQRCEHLEIQVSQAFQKLEELKVELADLATSQEEVPPSRQPLMGETTADENERMPHDESASLTVEAVSAESVYQDAYQHYAQGDYTEALNAFRQFFETHPFHDLADNALYWIGESHYAQKNYDEAITSFLEVVEKYPQGNKVPDSLLKIGFSYSNLKEDQKAREFLTQLMDDYPFSEEAGRAVVKLESLPQP
jgi:tol-pal system protein YbgF